MERNEQSTLAKLNELLTCISCCTNQKRLQFDIGSRHSIDTLFAVHVLHHHTEYIEFDHRTIDANRV